MERIALAILAHSYPSLPLDASSFPTPLTQNLPPKIWDGLFGHGSKEERQALASIRKLHRLLRLPNPVDDEVVSIALRRALRAKRRRPKQALGLNADLRRQLIDACPADGLHGLRDRALIAVGYDGFCRRSELVGLLIKDLRPLPDRDARILVRRAKTDPFGDSRWAYLSPPTMDDLRACLAAAANNRRPALSPVVAGKAGGTPIHPVAVNRTLETAARRAGLNEDVAALLSGHSMRIGAGRDLLHIMTADGWTSTVGGRHGREVEVEVEVEGRRLPVLRHQPTAFPRFHVNVQVVLALMRERAGGIKDAG
jgi:integrase